MSDDKNINITSHNQQGGITAYQVNLQPNDRVLSESLTSQLQTFLKQATFNSIHLTAVMGDQEALRFASQIKNFLTDNEYEVNGVNQAIFTKPIQGQIIEPPNNDGIIKIIIGGQ